MTLLAVSAELPADLAVFSPLSAATRALRKTRAGLQRNEMHSLRALPAFRAHLSVMDPRDSFFFVSHRHYLARGLTLPERTAAALSHYRHESTAYTPRYVETVYGRGRLVLWQRTVESNRYDIRLCPAQDVPYEGGLSVVLCINGNRVCVLSLSFTDRRIPLGELSVGPAGAPLQDVLPFVTRKQLPSDHSWQKAFNKAFHRVTAAHLCFGAIAGVAAALGMRHVAGIRALAHPSCTPELQGRFERAYEDFWETLGGTPAGERACLIALPVQRAPAGIVSASHRKRIEARRAMVEDVRQSAASALTPFLA